MKNTFFFRFQLRNWYNLIWTSRILFFGCLEDQSPVTYVFDTLQLKYLYRTKLAFFLSHWCTGTTRISTGRVLANIFRGHSSFALLLFPRLSIIIVFVFYRTYTYRWNGIQPVHMLVITRKRIDKIRERIKKMCKKSLTDGEREKDRKWWW